MIDDVFGLFQCREVRRLRISAGRMTADILTWGATVADLHVPWRDTARRVVLGLKTLDDYVKYSPHMGAIAGPFANRIRNARFELGGKAYDLTRNFLGRHCLHGGDAAFGKRAWELTEAGGNSVTLAITSPDGEAGFPGNLMVMCQYTVVEPATLRVALRAVTDKPTPVNLAPHGYFSLDGEPTIEHHTLQIDSDFYTVLDEDRVCTGEIRRVEGTPYDFRMPRPVIERDGGGALFSYDINFCVRGWRDGLTRAATLRSALSGLSMEVWSDQPGLQFYDGHNVNIPVDGIHGRAYGPRSGLCLEPQAFPNSPNIAHFPDCILRPGEELRRTVEFRFSEP
jgi:aldose 1-epimerase